MNGFFLKWLSDGVLIAIGIYVVLHRVVGGFFKNGRD